MRYFDPTENKLIYLNEEATEAYWDELWEKESLSATEIRQFKSPFITQMTARFLAPTAGPILEGGCGRGHHVSALTNLGYETIGLDYAPKTVSLLNQIVPELTIRLGDVRSLPFPDKTFAGYWSLGVIEHFWDGFAPIGQEMSRVIQDDGFLFLTFPYISPLRQLKSRLGGYPIWQGTAEPNNFYQFALHPKQVLSQFNQWGFKLIYQEPMSGLKGTKDEIPFLHQPLQKLFDYKGKNIGIRAARWLLTKTLTPVAGHSILLVLQKSNS